MFSVGLKKAFLITVILTEVRRQSKIALVVISFMITITRLPDGKTVHTVFKIPKDLDSNGTPMCAVISAMVTRQRDFKTVI